MSVRRLTNGVYLVRWLDGDVHRARRVGSREEALRLDRGVRDVKAARRLAGLGVASRLSLAAYLDDYWAGAHGQRLALGTRRQRRGVLAAHVEPWLGTVRLCDLSKPRLEKWMGDLRAAGVSPARATVALRDLSAVLGKAVEDELLPVNPATRVKGFRPASMRKPAALGPVAIERVRSKLPTLRDVVLVCLVGYGGLRPGEAAALRWEDVRPDGLYVDEAWAEGELKPPKSWQTRLVVDLPVPLLDDLATLKGSLEEGEDGEAFVCANRWGDPLDLANFGRRVWRPARDAAGLPATATLKSLRHSAASMWVLSGKPLTFVQSQLGHQSLKLTAETYTHATVAGWRDGVPLEDQIRRVRKPLRASVRGVAAARADDLGVF